MSSIAQLESAFASSDDTVVAALPVLKKSFISGVGSVAKRFVPKTPGKPDQKPRVLAVTVLRHVESRRLIVKVHVLKANGPNELRVSDTWDLKQLTRVELKTTSTSATELILAVESKTLGWTCSHGEDLASFIGCLSVLSTETLPAPMPVTGIDSVDVARWAEEYRTRRDEGKARAPEQKGRDRKGDASTSGVQYLTKEEEKDLMTYLDTYDVDIGDVTTLESRVREEVYELEAANAHALMERAKNTAPLRAALQTCDGHLDDLEHWLAVFSVKLSNMRQDIRAIEERNSDLEASSRNNSILIETMKEFIGMLNMPPGVEETVRSCTFTSDEDIEAVNDAIEKLHAFKQRLHGKELQQYSGMRAVKEQQEYCNNLCNDLIAKIIARVKSVLEEAVMEKIDEGLDCIEDGLPQYPDWKFMHAIVGRYQSVIHSLKKIDERGRRLILRTYCQVANKLMRHQLRDTVAQVRKASERSRPDKAFTIALDRFVGVLVDETAYMIEAFDDETIGGDRAMFRGNNKADIQSLLEGFQAELIRVSDSVAKVDSMLCVPMLGSVGRALAKAGDSDGDPLVACLDACHQSIQSRLFAFLDESIIKAEKPSESTNRSVVDALLRKKAECAVLNEVGFPSLLISKFQSFEEGGTQPINHGLDATYAKILRATFDSIESSASEDSKRASRIRLINYAHLAEHLREPAAQIGGIVDEYMRAAEVARKSACTAYASKIAEKDFGPALEVAHHMHTILDTGVPVTELPMMPGCTRDAIAKMLRSGSGLREKSVLALFKRVSQHLAAMSPALFNIAWEECTDFVVGWFAYLDSVLASPAYDEPLSPTPDELREMFRKVNIRATPGTLS